MDVGCHGDGVQVSVRRLAEWFTGYPKLAGAAWAYMNGPEKESP